MFKIKAATIQETIVALTIIMMIFSMATMVYLRVVHSSQFKNNLMADVLIHNQQQITLNEKRFFNEQIEHKGLLLIKRVESFDDSALLKISFDVFKGDRILSMSKIIVIKPFVYD